MLINGLSNYAKIIGEPVQGFGNTYREWTVDLILDKKTEKRFKDEGLGKLLKETKDGRVFVKFRRKALNNKGQPNDPIEVIDNKGNLWGKELIGNDSELNVSFNILDLPTGKYLWANKIQVWNHVPYEGGDEFPTQPDTDQQELWNDEAV